MIRILSKQWRNISFIEVRNILKSEQLRLSLNKLHRLILLEENLKRFRNISTSLAKILGHLFHLKYSAFIFPRWQLLFPHHGSVSLINGRSTEELPRHLQYDPADRETRLEAMWWVEMYKYELSYSASYEMRDGFANNKLLTQGHTQSLLLTANGKKLLSKYSNKGFERRQHTIPWHLFKLIEWTYG